RRTPPQGAPHPAGSHESSVESEVQRITEPARLLRVSSMARSLLDELHELPLDEHARERLRMAHARTVEEIGHAVTPELSDELDRLLPDSSGPLSQAEARIVQSQLVGWLEGVFQGVRAELSLHQMAARHEAAAHQPNLPPRPVPGRDSGPYL
ncbi:proteasome activator, partial [Nonomuraea aridisoli]|uniref:proteasome activator n=1 Tax=Nonomuraea aridisoli TaxID=2070368 RepID=UPI0011B947FA